MITVELQIFTDVVRSHQFVHKFVCTFHIAPLGSDRLTEFKNIITEQFGFVKSLRRTEDKSVIMMRHKILGTEIVIREFSGESEVYKVLQSLSHPNLPKVYSVEQTEKGCRVVEEYINGITVAEVLTSGLYTVKGAKEVAKGVCNALHTLHSLNIIHRDIKPENVMIDTYGTVKLIDFDASRIYKSYRSHDTSFIGTAGFAAPEQYGISQTDPRSDIFSLGILINVMLTGEHPSKKLYKGRLTGVIEKCINIDPNKRYANVNELYDKL